MAHQLCMMTLLALKFLEALKINRHAWNEVRQAICQHIRENTRKRKATENLISDGTQSKVSNRVKNMLRTLFIDGWKYEPCY